MKYKFKIIETYEKVVEVEAPTEDDARNLLEQNYMAGNIKFDKSEDFHEWEIYLLTNGKSPNKEKDMTLSRQILANKA